MKSTRRFNIHQYVPFIAGVYALFILSTAQADVATDIAKVREQSAKLFGGVNDAEIIKSPAKNVYRIGFSTGGFAFAYVEGDFVLVGDLYNAEKKENLSEKATNEAVTSAINEFPLDKMIVFSPKSAKRHVTIFTDTSCGWCRVVHNQWLSEINAGGVEVRYLVYPRNGLNSNDYKQQVSVWCSDDKQKALTDAKSGRTVSEATCDNPVAETYALAKKVGVRGTPLMVTDTGVVIPGASHVALNKEFGLNLQRGGH